MRIALFRELSLDFPGGVTHVMNLLIKYLITNGHEVFLFALDTDKTDHLGAKVVSVPSCNLPFWRGTKFNIGRPTQRLIIPKLREFNIELAHVLHPVSIGLCAIISAKKLNIPVVASYHTQYHLYLNYYHKLDFLGKLMWAFTRWTFNKCDINLSPSASVAEMMSEGGINNVNIWSRGVDSETFSPSHRDNSWRLRFTGNNPDSKIILYVGRLYKEKNLRNIIDVIKNIDGAVFVFVGDGPEREYLSKSIPDGKAFFLGRLTGKELSVAYSSSDIFLFPSKTEGCPNVVMEAVSSGLPVVGIDSYGVSDIVSSANCGFLYKDGNRNNSEIIENIRKIINDDSLRCELSRNARTFALAKTWDSVFSLLYGYYNQAVKINKNKTGSNTR